MKRFLVSFTLLFSLSFSTAPAFATDELHIGPGLGTPCGMGLSGTCTGLFMGGTEVVPLGSSVTKVDVFLQGGGGTILQNPMLLILGVPDSSGSDAAGPTISPTLPGGGTAALATSDVYGGNWNSSGVADDFTSSSTQGVYEFLGLNDNGSKANQFVNWQGADSAVNGMSVSEFDIFVYLLNPNPELAGANNGFDVNFSSALSPGTFVVAFGCNTAETGNNPCSGKGKNAPKAFFTPFTNAGLTQPPPAVPEPGALALFGTGLLSLAGLVRHRLRSHK